MDLPILRTRFAWWVIFVTALIPFLWVPYQIFFGDLGIDPGEALVEHFGFTAIVFIVITLALTPVKNLLGVKSLIRYRRMQGLYCLFYAVLHVLSYLLFIANFSSFVEDIYKRPYITIGFAAFLILIALGVTSPRRMVRKLGKKWKSLHKTVYVCAILAVVHFWWQARADLSEPVLFAVLVGTVLFFRLPGISRWSLSK